MQRVAVLVVTHYDPQELPAYFECLRAQEARDVEFTEITEASRDGSADDFGREPRRSIVAAIGVGPRRARENAGLGITTPGYVREG